MSVATGLDRVTVDDPGAMDAIRGKLGLLSHPASVDRRLRHARTILGARADVRVLFGPEHGYGGEAQDMIGVGAARDPEGLPIHSLYGATEKTLSPQPEMLEGLDAVIIDLQDVGARYYTYVWTAALMLETAAELGVRTVVLDRPNPLGGAIVEGAPQRSGYRSFVGLRDVAVRHGMSLGEILNMVAKIDGIDPALLEVVRMQGYTRAMRFEQTSLPWVAPSPNMPTLDTARVYPGGCLIEGTELSEGRGLTRPFEVWGAPGLDGRALAERCAIDGAVLRATTFTPTFHKHSGEVCGGVQVHVTDVDRFAPYAAYIALLACSKELLGDAFCWRERAYEFVEDIPAIDLLSGGPELREAIDAGVGVDDVLAAEREGAAAFAAAREAWLLYR